MRVVNCLLHFALQAVFVLLMLGMMRGQNPVNQPDGIDAAMDNISGGGSGIIQYPEPIAIGDVLAVCVYSDTLGGGTSGTYPVTDTLGNTFTLSPVVLTPGITNPTNVYIAYTTSAFAGNDTISTPAFTFYGSLQAGRFQHLSGVVDASSTATATGTGSVASMATSTTTTVNGDLLVSCAGAGGGSDRYIMASTNEYNVQQDQQGKAILLQSHTTTKGVQAQSVEVWGASATFGMLTLAFKPTPSIYIADAVLPDAAASVAYSAKLHGFGGTAAYTYACTGLPANGLSLNTATGVISGATPTAGTLSLGCTVTDGIITSATNTLGLTIGAAFNTPALRSSVSSNFDLSTTITVPNVICGDIITLTVTGDDTHNGNGWIQAVNGTNNHVSDSASSTYTRVTPHGGVLSSPLVTYVSPPILVPGTLVITVINNQSSSSGNEALAIDWSGVQAGVDIGSVNANMFTAGGGTVSNSITTVVPNEVAVATSMNSGVRGGFTTYTIGAPFGVVNLTGDLLVASANIAAAGSVTEAVSFTSANALDAIGNSLWALRPALPVAACNSPNGPGEKIRRQAF